MRRFAAFSTGTKSYIPFVRVLAKSFLKHHGEFDYYYLIIDEIDNNSKSLYSKEPFIPIFISELKIKHLKSFLFKYDVLEVSTAVKPFTFLHLFKMGYEKIIFFDADIKIYSRLKEVLDSLKTKSIILTPHITSPLPDDGKKISTKDIIFAGTYNLGFLAVAKTKESIKHMSWWAETLYKDCYLKVKEGTQVDQKWMELTPSFAEHYEILKHPGYNVSYWNLHERKIKKMNEKYIVNGKPLRFFHFSGIDINDPELLSKHQTRYRLKDFPQLKELFFEYCNEVKKAGYDNFITKPYRFNYFDNGEKIPKEAREIYGEIIKDHEIIFKNPFSTKKQSFYHLLFNSNSPITPYLSYKVKKSKTELKTLKDFMGFAKKHRALAQKDTDFLAPKKGLNVYGYLKGEFGVGKIPSYFLKAIKEKLKYSLSIIDAPHQIKDPNKSIHNNGSEGNYFANIYFVNADEIKRIKRELSFSDYIDKFEIGVWFWELEDFNPAFFNSFKELNEVWVFSKFMFKTLKKASPIPVYYFPFPYTPPDISFKKVEKSKFRFLMVFDYYSDFERKNPIGTVKAFKKAFGNSKSIELVIKTVNSKIFPEQSKRLHMEASKSKNIVIIDKYLDKNSFYKLFISSDAYVSLHKAEGLGLNILDAIWFELPVILTHYGGPIDFFPKDYRYFVKFKKVPISPSVNAYKFNTLWASPNLEEAAEKMESVYKDREYLEDLIKKTKNFMLNKCDPQKVGSKIKRRINTIFRNKEILKEKILLKDFKERWFNESILNFTVFAILQTTKMSEKLMIFYTAREERVVRILKAVSKIVGSDKIYIFGKSSIVLKQLIPDKNYLLYPQDGYYSLDKMPDELRKKLKSINFSMCIIPFFNKSGENYENIIEIAKTMNCSRIIGITIDERIKKIL